MNAGMHLFTTGTASTKSSWAVARRSPCAPGTRPRPRLPSTALSGTASSSTWPSWRATHYPAGGLRPGISGERPEPRKTQDTCQADRLALQLSSWPSSGPRRIRWSRSAPGTWKSFTTLSVGKSRFLRKTRLGKKSCASDDKSRRSPRRQYENRLIRKKRSGGFGDFRQLGFSGPPRRWRIPRKN